MMIPALKTPDSTIAFLRDGYPFISRRCDRLGTDGFSTRLLFKPVTCIRGADAARIFYRDSRFDRAGAFPNSVQHLLQDEGSVQSLEGQDHDRRKALFLSILQSEGTRDIEASLASQWDAAVTRWQRMGSVNLHAALPELLTRTGAEWAGCPLDDAHRRAGQLSAMIENAARVGPLNWRARVMRNRCERWAQSLVNGVRTNRIRAPEGSALSQIASYRGEDGRTLDQRIAGVELLNILRPIVAVERFIVFSALALLQQPQWYETFRDGDETDLAGFVNEVRRFYPFFPVVAGRVRKPFEWQGHAFSPDDWVLLDLYGTNHDARLWPDPESFRPERFRDWSGDPDTLIPQGGGDHETGHRCPAEPLTVVLMKQAVRLLAQRMRYQVGPQDLSVSLTTIPARPKDGFIIHDVRSEPAAESDVAEATGV